MSRMCDRMISNGIKPWPKDHIPKPNLQSPADLFNNTTILVIDNVAHYLYAGTPQTYWDMMTDFPSIAPPFERFWMEYNYPCELLTPNGIEKRPSNILRSVGFFFDARETKNAEADHTLDLLQILVRSPLIAPMVDRITTRMKVNGQTDIGSHEVYMASGSGERIAIQYLEALSLLLSNKPGLHIDNERVKRGIKWPMYTDMYFDITGNVYGPILRWMFLIGPDGLPVVEPMQMAYRPADFNPDMGNEVWSALLALSFLHCKNVTLATNTPPAKLSRAHQKRRGRPLMTFKTLEIEPMKRVLKHEGRSETTGLKKALHICRGHFKDYSKHGLFGKYKGLYWWDSHVRGNAAQGTIVKDYAVKVKP
jgi:hypothetical protein